MKKKTRFLPGRFRRRREQKQFSAGRLSQRWVRNAKWVSLGDSWIHESTSGGLFLKCWGRHISPIMAIWGLGYKLMFARNLWYISSPNNCTIWSSDDITRCLFLFFCGRNGIISNWMVILINGLRVAFLFSVLTPFLEKHKQNWSCYIVIRRVCLWFTRHQLKGCSLQGAVQMLCGVKEYESPALGLWVWVTLSLSTGFISRNLSHHHGLVPLNSHPITHVILYLAEYLSWECIVEISLLIIWPQR